MEIGAGGGDLHSFAATHPRTSFDDAGRASPTMPERSPSDGPAKGVAKSRLHAARVAAFIAHERWPDPASWGLCSMQLGGFLWFEDADSMLDFLFAHVPVLVKPIPAIGHEQHSRAIRHIVSLISLASSRIYEALPELNAVLGVRNEIEWWGTFESLCRASDPFESTTRSDFIYEKSGTPTDRQIPPTVHLHFVNWLRDYAL
jgi:hypothetical protein